MKYGRLFFLLVICHGLTSNGMQYKNSKNPCVDGVDQSYVRAMHIAFKKGDKKEVIRLYKLDPRLLSYLHGLTSEQCEYAVWAQDVLMVAEKADQAYKGRVSHASHPVVQKRLDENEVRARL